MTTNSHIQSVHSNSELQNPMGHPMDAPCAEKNPQHVDTLYPLAHTSGFGELVGCLQKKSLLRLTGDHSGEKLFVVTGLVWITQSGDPEDIFLRAGESFDIAHKGAVLVEGVIDTRLKITTSQEPPAVGKTFGDTVHHLVSGL
jgi:hypothetical protein